MTPRPDPRISIVTVTFNAARFVKPFCEAVASFRQAVRLRPTDAEARNNLTRALLMEGGPGTAGAPAPGEKSGAGASNAPHL